MPASGIKRTRGACLQCVRKKRRCDKRRPKCSQCLKNNSACELQVFKIWNPEESGEAGSSTQRPNSNNPLIDDPDRHLGPLEQDSAQPLSLVSAGATLDDGFWLAPPLMDNFGTPAFDIDTRLSDHNQQIVDCANLFRTCSQEDAAVLSAEPNRVLDLDNEPDPILNDTQYDIPQSVDSLAINQVNHPALDNIQPGTSLISYDSTLRDRQEYLEIPSVSTHCPVPWPPDMLSSPDRRFLWQYFLHITKAGFLCLDAKELPRFQGSQDPFISTIPQMAISNEYLRNAVFCFAAFQYNTSRQAQDFQTLFKECSRKASSAFQIHPNSLDRQGWPLFSIIACGIFLHHFGHDVKQDYLHLASGLATSFSLRLRSSSDLLAPFIQLILSMLRWSIVSTVCSFRSPRALMSDDIYRGLEMRAEEVEHNYQPSFRDWTNHPIFAFSPRLVNPLLRIARLLDIQKSWPAGQDFMSNTFTESEMIKLEEELLTAREVDMNVTQAGTTDPEELRCLNEAMHASAFLLFYARIRGMPFTAPLIRHKVQVVVSEIARIHVESRVSHGILFPLFIAGCEAVDSEARREILERLRTPRGLTYNRTDVCLALEHAWQIRDLDPGSKWPKWFHKVKPSFHISSLF
ncbi:hypothetical protein EsH8_V_000124 [Colletotrichum jinshuiense]